MIKSTTFADIYQNQPLINQLHQIMFPAKSLPSPVALAYVWQNNLPLMKSLGDVIDVNVKSSLISGNSTYQIIDLGFDQLDSYWWVVRYSPERAHQFIEHLQQNNTFELLVQLSQQDLEFASLLEKAFFQRDIYQIYSIFHALEKWRREEHFDYKTQSLIQDYRFLLKMLFQESLFDDDEFRQLKAYRPKKRPSGTCADFHAECHYVPEPIFGKTDKWYTFRYSKTLPKHFIDFQGRSFFKFYMKIPNMSPAEVHQLVVQTYNTFGEDITLTTTNLKITPGTETMLVRTMGVHLKNGYYADSGICEGFTMRIFTRSQQQFDNKTHDFRGTQIIVNNVSRKKLFEKPDSLGLVTVELDAPSFFGFYSGAPDLANSYSDSVTTTRYNCISCHSELHYGFETIFSLAHEPSSNYQSQHSFYTPILSPSDRPLMFFKNTEEMISMDNL